MNISVIDERIRRILAAVRRSFRGKINTVNTAGGVQTAQLAGLATETLPGVELFQHYGFTSAPPAGTAAVVIPIGGKTSHSIIVATEHSAYRLQGLENGEVAIYTDEGASIVLKRGKVIEASADTFTFNGKNFNVNASQQATFTTPNLQASEQVTAAGAINGNGGLSVKGGAGAAFEGNVSQTSGDFTSKGKVIGSNLPDGHIHNTPDGKSGPPIKP